MSHDEARLAARRALGGVTQARERHREARSFRWIDNLRQDARGAIRSLMRSPGFTAVVLMVLTLAMGASTAIYSLVDGVVLRRLPFPESDRLVTFDEIVEGRVR